MRSRAYLRDEHSRSSAFGSGISHVGPCCGQGQAEGHDLTPKSRADPTLILSSDSTHAACLNRGQGLPLLQFPEPDPYPITPSIPETHCRESIAIRWC